jgi:hypothetical protein
MDVLEQSGVSAAVRMSETEAKLLSLAMRYWQDAMAADSPLVEDLAERLLQISNDFDAVLSGDLENV